MGPRRSPLLCFAFAALAASCGVACTGSDDLIDGLFTEAEWEIISGLSPLPEVPRDPTNAYGDDARAAALGQKLFFDPGPAGPIVQPDDHTNGGLGEKGETGKVSCASCHMPDDGWFQDERSNPPNTSLGVNWGTRNAPPVVNAVFYDWYKWDGSADSMWMQALGTLESSRSHGSSRLAVAHNVAKYRDEYDAIFREPLDPDFGNPNGRFPPAGKPGDAVFDSLSGADQEIVNNVFVNCAKSIEAYERLLVSRNAAFDRYVAGDMEAISPAAKRGLKLFIGKAGCIGCHNTPLFSDSRFHNTAVPQEGTYVPEVDNGRYDAIPKLLASEFRSNGPYSDDRITGKLDGLEQTEALRGAFRTKHLREVAETGPYMHTGAFASLEEILDHYDQGGAEMEFSGEPDRLMVKLNLSFAEKEDLVAFLETLTGEPIPESLREDTSLP